MWFKFNYKFYEKEHYYEYEGKRVKTSVTQFISNFHKPFDEPKWSKHVAKRDNREVEDVLAEWAHTAYNSATTGTLFHNRAEQLAIGKHFEVDYSNYGHEIRDRIDKLIPMQDKFFKDIDGKLLPLKTEFTVGLEDFIAGNLDLLVWNERDQEIQIWDYKTNKEINLENKYEKMKYPFHKHDSCNFVHYSIQLNIYKYIINKILGIKVGKCYIAHFNENNESYRTYKCLDLSEEVKIALEEVLPQLYK